MSSADDFIIFIPYSMMHAAIEKCLQTARADSPSRENIMTESIGSHTRLRLNAAIGMVQAMIKKTHAQLNAVMQVHRDSMIV